MPRVLTTLLALVLFASASAEPPPPHPNRAKGSLHAINLRAGTLSVATKTGTNTFVLTEKTYIFRGKDKIPPAQLKPGEIIALSLYPGADGRLLINRIKAYPLSPASATNAPPATAP